MDFDAQNARLVRDLISEGLLKSPSVIEAFKEVPRHLFVPKELQSEAYVDTPLPIGQGQTISAPHMVAIMTELLDVRPDSRILEVGTGSGYQAALLAHLAPCGRIITIERIQQLVERVRILLAKMGYANIDVISGDGTLGHPKESPYDRIIVTAAAPKVPKELVKQLRSGGRMLVPVGARWSQTLVGIEKDDKGNVTEEDHRGVVFVPLLGEQGW